MFPTKCEPFKFETQSVGWAGRFRQTGMADAEEIVEDGTLLKMERRFELQFK